MVITLYKCNDDRRKLYKTLTEATYKLDCTITHPCDILRPEVILDASATMGWDVLNKNYARLNIFSRFYFINDYTIDTAARIHLHLEVDALYNASYNIETSSQHVVRSESVNGGKSTMIVDDKMPLAPYKDMKVILFEGGELGLSNATEYSLNYVLNVAGGGGN